MNLFAPFCGGRAKACPVGLEDDGAVQDVAASGKIEVIGWVVFEAERFEGWKGVDGSRDGLWTDRRG